MAYSLLSYIYLIVIYLLTEYIVSTTATRYSSRLPELRSSPPMIDRSITPLTYFDLCDFANLDSFRAGGYVTVPTPGNSISAPVRHFAGSGLQSQLVAFTKDSSSPTLRLEISLCSPKNCLASAHRLALAAITKCQGFLPSLCSFGNANCRVCRTWWYGYIGQFSVQKTLPM